MTQVVNYSRKNFHFSLHYGESFVELEFIGGTSFEEDFWSIWTSTTLLSLLSLLMEDFSFKLEIYIS